MTELAVMPLFWTVLFGVALVLGFVMRAWLTLRQAKSVAKHRHAVPQAFADKVSLAAHQKAADYTLAKLRLGFWDDLLGVAVLIGWTLLGGLAILDAALHGLWDFWGAALSPLASQVLLIVVFLGVNALMTLPVSLYQTFGLEARFGFNKTTGKTWVMDTLKSVLLGLVIGLPLLWLVLYLMQVMGSWWWLWAWGAVSSFTLVMMWLAPSVIMPLFNKFTPLTDEALAARVKALMQRCGFVASGLFVMDGSKRSAHSNAFFVGFGSTKRVVFYDTLLAQITPDELEAVLAHELGHAHHHHIIKRLLLQQALSFAGFALMGWLFQKAWFYEGLGVNPLSANAALALLLFVLCMPVFTFFVTPLAAYFSRRDERQADAYACAHSDPKALASALLTLYEDNASTLTPDSTYAQFYASHPPAVERITRLLAWRGSSA